MTRSNAREIACHLVFEMNFNDITAGEALRTLMEEAVSYTHLTLPTTPYV